MEVTSRAYLYSMPGNIPSEKEFCKFIESTVRKGLPEDIRSMTVRCKGAKGSGRPAALHITICDATYPLTPEDDDTLLEPATDQEVEGRTPIDADEVEDMDISDTEGLIVTPRAPTRHPVTLAANSDDSVEKEKGVLQERSGIQDGEENHDGELEERVLLAENLRGSTKAAIKLRQRFLVSVLKRAFEEGKVVVSNWCVLSETPSTRILSLLLFFTSFESEYLILRYVLDESQSDNEVAGAILPAMSSSAITTIRDPEPTAVAEQIPVAVAGATLPSNRTTPLTDVEMEDVKPLHRGSPQPADKEEVDQLATPEPEVPVVPFPLQGRGSSWDCQGTKVQAKKFIAA